MTPPASNPESKISATADLPAARQNQKLDLDPPIAHVPLNARLLLLTCGIGGRWPASGTWGSMPPVALALLLVWLLGHNDWSIFEVISLNVSLVLIALAFTVACVRFGEEGETCYACKDPRHVVADEVAGQSIALLFIPWRGGGEANAWAWNLLFAATAFLIFRAMDIIKPPPARGLQRLSCGWGIVVDDLIAGAYALLLTQVLTRWLWPAVVAMSS